jgi:hypothetical protein
MSEVPLSRAVCGRGLEASASLGPRVSGARTILSQKDRTGLVGPPWRQPRVRAMVSIVNSHQNRVASAGDRLKIFPWVASRVAYGVVHTAHHAVEAYSRAMPKGLGTPYERCGTHGGEPLITSTGVPRSQETAPP